MKKCYLLLLVLPIFWNAQLGMGAQEVIDRMTQAHGNLKKWRQVPSVQFRTHISLLANNWPDYHEKVTVQPLSRQAYVDFLTADGSKAEGSVTYTGETAWAIGKREGLATLPPRLTAWRNFFLFNIPFVIYDPGVRIKNMGIGKLPDQDQDYLRLRMTFDSGVGDTPKDYYTLYIHPEHFRLEAAEYMMTYAGIAPSSPCLIIFKAYTQVDGFTVPSTYHLYNKADMKLLQRAEIKDWRFDVKFDEKRMIMPQYAELDTSKAN
ncbi:MAG: DUF6503 family protein [Saprospiraceae bacterium]|nr:DUF6503 family protein [Saprospiraceae bacterium]